MALPVGVITATVSWGTFLDFLGVPWTDAKVTIGASTDLTWSATGTALMRSALVGSGVTGSMVLPATDQPGFVAGGQPITGWSYTATIQATGQPDRVVVFQLPTAGASGVTLDLDVLIPLAGTTPGTVATVPAILSVNGQTGPTVTLTAANVGALPVGTTPAQIGALPSDAPAVLKNTAGSTSPLRVRNQADTADVFAVSTAGGSVTLSGNLTAGQALIAGATGNAAATLTAADAGIRFGPTAGQTYIQRTGTQALSTDSSIAAAGSIQTTANSADAVQAQGAAGGIRFGPTAGQTYIQRAGTQLLVSDSYLRARTSTTAARASATGVGGSFYYDTTLNKPVWSDGTNWRDAAGTIV